MKIKKFMVAAVATMLCLAGTMTAFAAGISTDEQAIIDKLKAGFTVDGKTVSVPTDIINQVENEFMKNETDVTAAQASVIEGKMDEVIAFAQANDVTDVASAKEYADDIIPLVQAAASEIGYTVAYDASSDTGLTVSDPEGNTVYTSKAVVNQTGFDMTAPIAVGVGMVAILAACVVVASKKNLFAKTELA